MAISSVRLILSSRLAISNAAMIYFCRFSHVSRIALTDYKYYIEQSRCYSTNATPVENQKLGVRVLKFIGWISGFYSRKSVIARSAKKLYEDCIDNIDYESFMKNCDLPDTFFSWFLVAHLHIWLLLVRLKREGKDGSYFINQLVLFFWMDVEDRMKVLGLKSSDVKKTLKELDQQLRGLIAAYEEGLLTNDKILASAIWRNWVSDKTKTDPIMLSLLVMYVRGQVYEMDKTNSEELLTKEIFKIRTTKS